MMSDAVVVAIIAAVPSTLSCVILLASAYHVWHVPIKLNELVEHTNGLTQKLMEKTDIAGIAAGVQQEKDRKSDASDQTAIAILAAAQVGADKVLAAAKLAADQILAAAKLAKEG